MRTRIGSLAVAGTLATVMLLTPAGVAQAKLTAKVSVTESSGARIQVVLSSTATLSSRARPRSVRVRSGSTTFTLTRSSASAARTVKLGTWRTGKLTGTKATRARALRGKTVSVLVRSRAGRTTTLRPKVAAPAPSAPTGPTAPAPTTPTPAPTGPTAPAQPFTAPGQVLTGQPAIDSFGKYFFNSEFSDCFGGRWPSCTVEERYEHFQDGSFIYRRCTPTSGSDINYVSAYQIVGAQQNADGSWVVEYRTQGNSFQDFYHWEVGQNGVANGYYVSPGGDQQQLLNYQWRQPAYGPNCYGD